MHNHFRQWGQEMIIRTHIARPLLLLPLLVVLAGCAPAGTDTTEPTPGVTATPEALLPDSSATPQGTPAPDSGEDSNVLSLEGAYQLCIDNAAQNQIDFQQSPTIDGEPRTRDDFVNASFADSTVTEREDGYFFVYSNLIDLSAPADLTEAAASYCLVTGTVSEPSWETYGLVEREFGETIDPNAPLDSMP